ncbi:hypothetical protein [Nonlabens xiamenensis]|uniref:hypothetical protein n=1 Tax=Nonlabens xiamenensis TaxID=2341043 RepID=UPI000F615005|nr:hypothetical protein [Nonlabens xiamenensis]
MSTGIVKYQGSVSPAPLSNYLGAFETVAEIQALPQAGGNEADLIREGQADQRWFFDTNDAIWQPYGDEDFKGYFVSVGAVIEAFPLPLPTWVASNNKDRSINYIVYNGRWIQEPTQLDAAYVDERIEDKLPPPSPPGVDYQGVVETGEVDTDNYKLALGNKNNFSESAKIEITKGNVEVKNGTLRASSIYKSNIFVRHLFNQDSPRTRVYLDGTYNGNNVDVFWPRFGGMLSVMKTYKSITAANYSFQSLDNSKLLVVDTDNCNIQLSNEVWSGGGITPILFNGAGTLTFSPAANFNLEPMSGRISQISNPGMVYLLNRGINTVLLFGDLDNEPF